MTAPGTAPTTLAALRRFLAPGTPLRLVESLLGPTPPDAQARTVSRWQSNALVLSRPCGRESYLWIYSAKDLRFALDGFSVVEEEGRGGPCSPVVGARYLYGDGKDGAA